MVKENPILQCPHCRALVWYSESTGTDATTGKPIFTICCQQGRVKLPPIRRPPAFLEYLHANSSTFRLLIRVYNSMLAFTSMGAKIDHSVTSTQGPPAFRIHGQVYHRIGSLLPMPGKAPQYLQMYIVDTENEVSNRIKTMPRKDKAPQIDEEILGGLVAMLDEHNCLCMFFRKARDRFEENAIEELKISLVDKKGKGRQYDLPQIQEIAGLIVGDFTTNVGRRDVVLELQSNHLQQIRDDHPLLMSLQYPVLFPYGEFGYHTEIPHAVTQRGERKRTFISIREYYAYQIQTRLSEGMTLIKGGRLLHQYVVDAYTSIEQERLRWARNNQDQLRADLYSNVFDAVGKGETDAAQVGQRTILPSSFTGGPRYMIEKYHDAMAICRTYGNPTLFVTMTANPNWPEIKEHLDTYGEASPNNRPDIESRVFKMKLDQLLKDLEQGTFFKPCIAGTHPQSRNNF